MAKKTPKLSPLRDPRIVQETDKTITIAFGDGVWFPMVIKRSWLHRNRKFLEALLTAAGQGRKRK